MGQRRPRAPGTRPTSSCSPRSSSQPPGSPSRTSSPAPASCATTPGATRLSEDLFGKGFRNWNRERDGVERRKRYLDGLHERSRAQGLELATFLPKKGDALLWAADLAHGSATITRPSETRRSFVCHYCPADVAPYYFAHKPERRTMRSAKPHCHYASSHYRLD